MNRKTQYKNQQSLRKELKKSFEGKGNLRFGRSYLVVSDIANQVFCEKKVELNYIYGAIEKEEKITGTVLHEEVSKDAMIVKFKQMIKNIHKKDFYSILETVFLIKYKGQFIIGRPDYIVFRKGIPIFIFDYKFSQYRMTFPDQHVQARIYCLILKEMGFNTDILFYGIIKGPLELKQSVETLKIIPKQIVRRINLDLLLEKGKMIIEFDQIIVDINKFEPSQAEKDFDWAIKYWKGERSAILTTNKKKCLNCEHKQICLAKNEQIKIDELMRIPLVKQKRAKILINYGINSLKDLIDIGPSHPISEHPSFRYFFEMIQLYARAVYNNKTIIKTLPEGKLIYKRLKNKNLYFFDSEYDPTGTSKGPFGIFLIGWMDLKGKVQQLFLPELENEINLLQKFKEWTLKNDPMFIAYGSVSGDVPQLKNSLKRLGLGNDFLKNRFFDVHQEIVYTQSYKRQEIFLPLEFRRLKKLSEYLGYDKNSGIGGGWEALAKYQLFLKTKNKEKKEKLKKDLLEYNEDDLKMLEFVYFKIKSLLQGKKP